jgi:3-hydroxyisobutyrate dehydrogenase
LTLKDLKLAQDAAKASGAKTPMGAGAAALYKLFVDHGSAGTDFSGIIRLLRGPEKAKEEKDQKTATEEVANN